MNGTRRVSLPYIALAVLGLIFSLWLHLRLGDMGFDDTWIHLRIARNLLATGHAWFNANERVMATSSPLWTLLMAALHVPSHLSILPVLEATLLWGAAVLAFSIARRNVAMQRVWLRDSFSLFAAWLAAVLLLSSSVGQMESPLAVLLMLGAWRAALANLGFALPLLAMAAVTRLELLPVWLLATVATLVWSRRHRLAALEGAAILLLTAAWTVVQFHVLLPNSMRAKRLSYDFDSARTVHQFVAPRLRDHGMLLLLLLLVVGAIYLVGRRRSAVAPRPAWWQSWLPITATLTGLLIVLEYIAGRTVVFDWYRPLYLVPLLLGVLLIAPSGIRKMTRAALACAQVLLLLWLAAPAARAIPLFLRAATLHTVAAKSAIDSGDYVRVQEYLQVGSVLQQRCPGARVLASEIGGLGWTFPGELLDGFGIASPAALRYQPLRSGAPKGGIPAAYLLEAKPDLVVSYGVMSDEVLNTPAVDQQYDLILLPSSPRSHRGGPLDVAWRSSTHLNVWIRRNSACNRNDVRQAFHAQLD